MDRDCKKILSNVSAVGINPFFMQSYNRSAVSPFPYLSSWGSWILRLIAAVIMLQTLFFKFSAAPESVYIFTRLEAEPYGRIVCGVLEALASLLILIPRTTWAGALLAAALMTSAIGAHLTVLGIEIMNDGGQLFVYALLVWFSSLVLLRMARHQWLPLLNGIPFLKKLIRI